MDERFRDDEACREYIRRLRWPQGFACPHCGEAGEPPPWVRQGDGCTRGRETESKAIVAIAVEKNGRGLGRIRLQQIGDVSTDSLLPFVQGAVERGAMVHTDGWRGYAGLAAAGYQHQVTVLSGGSDPAHEVMPRVHLVASLLKRWLIGTHQGGVQHQHL